MRHYRSGGAKARNRPGRFIINCAAYTAVDQAETEVEAAYRGQCDRGRERCRGVRSKLASPWFIFRPITSSTGKARSQRGKTIRRVRSTFTAKASSPARSRCGSDCQCHIILRTSWIFSAHGQNFVKTILGLAKTQSPLRVVDDQIGGPTAADDVAKAILDIIAISSEIWFC